MTFAVWPTAAAVMYFLGILMHYRMSMTLIRTAVMLKRDDDNHYGVGGNSEGGLWRMSNDLVKQADAFRLGSGPTDEQVNQANLLIDRMSSRIEELEAKLAEAVRHMSDEELLHREYEKLLRERIEELEADLRSMSLDYLAASGQAQENFQMYVDANEARIDAETKLGKAIEALEKVQAFVRDLEPHADQGHTLVPALRDACATLAELKRDTYA